LSRCRRSAITNAESSINVGSTRLDPEGRSPDGFRKVKVDTLDAVSCDLAPDVIKMDVEGAEALCLEGGIMTISRHRPTLLVEVNPELLRLMSGIGAKDLQGRLADSGYDLWAVHPDRLDRVRNDDDLGGFIPLSGVMNVLCVHKQRRTDVESLLPELLK
jgi:hypothetical protein